MEAIRLYKVVEKDGEIVLTGLPCRKGQHIEIILLPESSALPTKHRLTASSLLHSELIGLWKDRTDIEDSADYARQLRERAQRQE